jgi:hypothetical protein
MILDALLWVRPLPFLLAFGLINACFFLWRVSDLHFLSLIVLVFGLFRLFWRKIKEFAELAFETLFADIPASGTSNVNIDELAEFIVEIAIAVSSVWKVAMKIWKLDGLFGEIMRLILVAFGFCCVYFVDWFWFIVIVVNFALISPGIWFHKGLWDCVDQVAKRSKSLDNGASNLRT